MWRSISFSDELFLVNVTMLFQLWRSNRNRKDNATTYVQDKSNSINTWSRVKLSRFRPNFLHFPFFIRSYICFHNPLHYSMNFQYVCVFHPVTTSLGSKHVLYVNRGRKKTF